MSKNAQIKVNWGGWKGSKG